MRMRCRDDDHNVEQWTTVDPNRTNVREKAVQKLLQGFSLYIVLMGKNYPYENKIESRWRDTLIVCTIMASSGPVDTDGLLYLSTNRNASSNRRALQNANQQQGNNNQHQDGDDVDCIEQLEDKMDAEVSRKGVVRANKVILVVTILFGCFQRK